MVQGKRLEKFEPYMERYKRVWDIHTPKDERTAQEIIDDTFKRHGLKIKRGG